jgi:thiamine diphosphokinase
MHSLSLPQMTIDVPYTPTELLICVGGGHASSPAWFAKLLAMMAKASITSHIWAIDKGVDLCRAAAISPELLIGDGDSAAPAAWAWAITQGAEVRRFPPEKDDTDTALALQLAAQRYSKPLVILTAAFGGRMDHLFSTAMICAHASVSCLLVDEYETLLYLRGGASISVTCDEMPHAVSLLPFTEECAGVSTSGLHWELTDAVVSGQASTTISNIISPENTAGRFSVSLTRGVLGVYLCQKE